MAATGLRALSMCGVEINGKHVETGARNVPVSAASRRGPFGSKEAGCCASPARLVAVFDGFEFSFAVSAATDPDGSGSITSGTVSREDCAPKAAA